MPVLVKAAEKVVDVVVDVVEDVGGAVVDVVDFAVDKIVEPVVKVVGNVIDSALDDPIKAIAQIAAIATGNAWALPLIEGADVAIAGGDLSDILEATAKTYVAQQIGSAVGSKVSNSVYGSQAGVQAGVQTANEAIAAEVIGRAAGSAAAAVVTGQDPLQAFVTGGVSAGVPAILGKVDGFTDLPKSAQRAISSAVTAKALGRDIDATAIASMVAATEVTTRTLKAYDPDRTKLSDAEYALASDVLYATTSTALQGGNVSAAIQSQLIKAGTKQLAEMAKSGFKEVVDKVKKTYESADQNGMLITKNEADQKSTIDKYNAEKAKLDAKITEQERLRKVANDKIAVANKDTTNKANVDAANAATKAYNDYTKTVSDAYEKAKPILDGYSDDLSKLQVTHAELTDDYEDLIKSLATTTSPVQDKLDAVYGATNKDFVEVLDPKFNAAEYKKINNLGDDVDAYEHYLDEGQTKGLKTNNGAIAADIQGEKARLVVDLAAAKGIKPSQITDTDIKNFSAVIDKQYGTDINALKGASIQDLLRGDYRTYDDLLKDSKSEGFRVDIKGQAYGEWNKPKDFTPAEGTRLATLAEMDSGAGVLVYSDDGEPVWVTPVGVEEWDYTTGTTATKKSESISKAPTLEQLQFDDPEAALQTLGSMEKNATGGLDKFATTMANSMVLAAYATGNKSFGDKVKQTLSIVSQGVGEQVSSLASFIATQTGMGYDNALIKAGTALQDWGVANQSESTKKQEQNIIDAAKNAKGFVGTIAALATAIKDNPGGFGTFIAKEGIQEILPLGVAKWASKFGTLVAYGGNAAMEFAESYGGNAKDTYDQAKKMGLSEAEAQKKAEIVGLQAGVVTLLTAGIGDVPLVKTVISGFGKDIAARHFTGTAAEAASEFFDESLGNAAQQYQLTGQVNWATAWTAGSIGSAIGAGTTGSIMAGYSIADSAVVGRDAQGKNVTLGQFLEGTAVPTTINYDAVVGANKDGIEITLGDIGAAAKETDLAPIFDITVDSAPPEFRTAIDDATAMDADEARAFLISQGYTDPTAEEIKIFTDAGVTEAQARNEVSTWADPRVTSIDEARDMLTAAGYTNPTAEEISSLAGKIEETAAKTNIATYVDQHTVTPEEVKAAFEAEGYTPTAEQINSFIATGAEVNQDNIVAEITKQADAGAVTSAEARAEYERLGFADATEEDVARISGQYAESELGERTKDYLPVATYNATAAKIDTLSEDVQAKYETLSEGQKQIVEDLAKQGVDLTEAINTAKTELSGQITDLSEDVQVKYDALTDNQKALADQLTKQGVDLNTAIDTAKTELTTAIGETETRVTSEIQAVADLVGKPASQVTQADIDAVSGIITSREAEPTIDLTQDQLAYDVNQDGQINQNDLDILSGILTEPNPQWLAPEGSRWAPTGIYGTIAASEAAQRKAIADEAERTRQANAAAAQRTQRMGNLNSMMGMLMQAPDLGGQQVSVKQADPAKIGYVYDWSSIFANPTQQKMFTSPFGSYAEGGMVEDDVNAELIKMLRS